MVTLRVLILYVVAISGDKKSSLYLILAACCGCCQKHTEYHFLCVTGLLSLEMPGADYLQEQMQRLSLKNSYRFHSMTVATRLQAECWPMCGLDVVLFHLNITVQVTFFSLTWY